MAAQFKVGDVVELKSGGPKMTVREVDEDGMVNASWFAGSKHEDGWFPVDTLAKVAETK